MQPLDKDLQKPKKTLKEFRDIAVRILKYLPSVISEKKEKGDYLILSSIIAGTTKYVRPINTNLFIFKPSEFSKSFKNLQEIIQNIKTNKKDNNEFNEELIDKTLYTIQQSIGAGLDLLVNPNSARKHIGNRFEELIKILFTELGISNKKVVLQIPYETDEGAKLYKCENDLILSPFERVKSNNKNLDEDEIVVSIKTTSKDRMGKIFIDKMLLERFIGHKQKVIGIFLNDVQRKGTDNISFTLVSGLFMVYTKFLTELEGIYYLDPPPNALKSPYNLFMKPFSNLITNDIWNLLSS